MTCREIFRYYSGAKQALNIKSRYTEKVSLKIRGKVESCDLKSTYYFFVYFSNTSHVNKHYQSANPILPEIKLGKTSLRVTKQ